MNNAKARRDGQIRLEGQIVELVHWHLHNHPDVHTTCHKENCFYMAREAQLQEEWLALSGPAPAGKKHWWCCKADFGEHEPTCVNYVGPAPATRGYSYREDLQRDLKDPEFARLYLEAAKRDSPEALTIAKRNIGEPQKDARTVNCWRCGKPCKVTTRGTYMCDCTSTPFDGEPQPQAPEEPKA